MKSSESTGEINAALSKAQGAFKPAVKNSVNPHFKSSYSDFASIIDSVRDALIANGLVVNQELTSDARSVSVITRIGHSSGQWIEFGPFAVPVEKPNAHGVGSAGSYAKRYSLGAALGVVSENDDDGNAAVAQVATAEKQPTASAEFFSRPDQSGMPARKASPQPPPKQAAQTASAVDAARSAIGFADEQSSAGVRAWMDDKKGRFVKGQPIEDIGNDGLNFLLWLLNKGDSNPKFAAMDAARRAGIEAELKKRGASA